MLAFAVVLCGCAITGSKDSSVIPIVKSDIVDIPINIFETKWCGYVYQLRLVVVRYFKQPILLMTVVFLYSLTAKSECIRHTKENISGLFKFEKVASAYSSCSKNEKMQRIVPVKIPASGCVIELSLVKTYSGKASDLWTTKKGWFSVYSAGAMCDRKIGETIDLKLESDEECCGVGESAMMTGGPACSVDSKKWIKTPSERFVRCMSGGVWKYEILKNPYITK